MINVIDLSKSEEQQEAKCQKRAICDEQEENLSDTTYLNPETGVVHDLTEKLSGALIEKSDKLC